MKKAELDYLLGTMLDSHRNVSDLNLTVDKPPQVETSGELAPVQGDARALVDPPRQQLRGTGDAASVAAAVGQRHAPRLELAEQGPAPVDPEGGAAPVGERDRNLLHA